MHKKKFHASRLLLLAIRWLHQHSRSLCCYVASIKTLLWYIGRLNMLGRLFASFFSKSFFQKCWIHKQNSSKNKQPAQLRQKEENQLHQRPFQVLLLMSCFSAAECCSLFSSSSRAAVDFCAKIFYFYFRYGNWLQSAQWALILVI